MCCLSPASVTNARNNDAVEKAGNAIQILVPATAYAATLILDDKEGRNQFYKSFLLNLGVTYGLKLVVNNPRPKNNGDYSFPSGHTSASFQGATFIHKRYGWKYAIPAYIGAAYVGWSRVKCDKHYTSDVVGGAAIGILSSYFFTTPYNNVMVTPVAENGFYGLHLSTRW